MVWHNRYPEEWALVSREAIEEAGRGDDIVFFDRSGFTRSPGVATLFWLGDQLQTWDEYDGIKTAVVGLLSGGVSGFSLLHSDTGGYVVLKLEPDGRQHPGDRAHAGAARCAGWSSTRSPRCSAPTKGSTRRFRRSSTPMPTTLAHLQRFAKVYKGLAAYRKAPGRRGGGIAAIRWCGICSCTIRTTPTRSACATSSCSGRT